MPRRTTNVDHFMKNLAPLIEDVFRLVEPLAVRVTNRLKLELEDCYLECYSRLRVKYANVEGRPKSVESIKRKWKTIASKLEDMQPQNVAKSPIVKKVFHPAFFTSPSTEVAKSLSHKG
jgi:hypothetical protein